MALRYQHVAEGRDAGIADRLSKLVTSDREPTPAPDNRHAAEPASDILRRLASDLT
jgi:hypothetical protein